MGGYGRSKQRRSVTRVLAIALAAVLLAAFWGAATSASAGEPVPSSAPVQLVGASSPQAAQQAFWTADSAPWQVYGTSVAVSGDTALVGCGLQTVNGQSNAGAVYVYTRSGGVWSEQAVLTDPTAAASEYFGFSVALSGDVALIGATGKTVSGAAFVYTRSAGTWSQSAELTASDGVAADHFGYSVALSGDSALIGAYSKTVGGQRSAGAAYVFRGSGTSWSQEDELTDPTPAASDDFGFSVAISGDTALVGSWQTTVGVATLAGAAYIYTRSGTSWSAPEQLVASDVAANGRFGWSVAISGDTALIGAWGTLVGGGNAGAAYFFVHSGTTWPQQAEVTDPTATTSDQFGWAVALEADTAVIGAMNETVGAVRPGAAHVYGRTGTGWSPVAYLAPSDGASGDLYGSAVAVSGRTVVVGDPHKAVSGRTQAGAAYAYLLDSIAPTTTATGLQTAVGGPWVKASSRVSFSASDDAGGSGVAATYYTIDGGPQQTYTAPFTLSDGAHTVTYWSVDKAANVEAAHLGYANIDANPPLTGAQGLLASANPAWENRPLVTLSATDPESRVADTYYQIAGAAQQTYTAPFTLADGAHTVTYWSVDGVGNVEAAHTAYADIDSKAPTASAKKMTLTAAKAKKGKTLKFRLTIADPRPGCGSANVTLTLTSKKGKRLWSLVKPAQPTNKALTVSYKLKKTLKTGTYSIVCSSTDLAGNVQAKVTNAKLKIS